MFSEKEKDRLGGWSKALRFQALSQARCKTAGRVPGPTVPLLTLLAWAQPGAERFACGSQLSLLRAEAEWPLVPQYQPERNSLRFIFLLKVQILSILAIIP